MVEGSEGEDKVMSDKVRKVADIIWSVVGLGLLYLGLRKEPRRKLASGAGRNRLGLDISRASGRRAGVGEEGTVSRESIHGLHRIGDTNAMPY